MGSEQVMHKERGKEKGKSPYNPLKEKESQKEISAVPVPVIRAGAGTGARVCALTGAGAGAVDFDQSNSFPLHLRQGVSLRIDDETIRYSETDSVALALACLRIPKISVYRDGRRYNNARIFRRVLHDIGDDVFREVLIQQLHENECDGEPESRTRTFMAKLNRLRDEMRKGGEA